MLYLTPYVGTGDEDDPFRPVGADQTGWSAIDLRPDSTITDGWALLRVPVAFEHPGVIELGELDDSLNVQGTRGIENQLGLSRDALRDMTLRDIIAELLIVWGDEDDQPNGRWKKLLPERSGRLKIYLGGLIFDMAVPAGGATFTDDFNRPDESLADSPNWEVSDVDVWFVESNQLKYDMTAQRNTAHHPSTFNADSFAKMLLISASGSVADIGPVIRYDGVHPNSGTFYTARLDRANPGFSLSKFVSGSFTRITSAGTENLPQTLLISGEGSSITVSVDDVEIINATDTSIPGGGFAGVMAFENSTNFADNFEAGDLAAFDPANLAVVIDGTTAQLSSDPSPLLA